MQLLGHIDHKIVSTPPGRCVKLPGAVLLTRAAVQPAAGSLRHSMPDVGRMAISKGQGSPGICGQLKHARCERAPSTSSTEPRLGVIFTALTLPKVTLVWPQANGSRNWGSVFILTIIWPRQSPIVRRSTPLAPEVQLRVAPSTLHVSHCFSWAATKAAEAFACSCSVVSRFVRHATTFLV